jgi:putative alpha-1,2-mannosidase
MVSSGAMGLEKYKKGYPIGYNGQDFFGLSHFHASGPGTIRWYYNYFLFSPQLGDIFFKKRKQKIVREKATPGYFSCVLDNQIKAKATVASRSAMHRYSFPTSTDNNLVIDLSNYYKAKNSVRVVPEKFPESITAEFITPTSAQGQIIMDGFPIYFYLELDRETYEYGFFLNNEEVGKETLNASTHSKITGLYFKFKDLPGKSVTSQIGFSFKSLAQAKSNPLKNITTWNFDEIAQKASSKWNQYLSKFEITDPNDDKKGLFYSALYKAILMPANLQGENPFWESDN